LPAPRLSIGLRKVSTSDLQRHHINIKMSLSLPQSLLSQARRARPSPSNIHAPWKQQTRNATLIRRPKRPYTFTQLVTLTDGSAYLQRTTSPLAVYRSTKDMRNSPMWNPSSQVFLNVEEDEAGKLRKFREKFGRSWDSQDTPVETVGLYAEFQAATNLA
jgi:hypothetical protein